MKSANQICTNVTNKSNVMLIVIEVNEVKWLVAVEFINTAKYVLSL